MSEIKFRAWVHKNRMIFSDDTYGSYIRFFEECRLEHDGFGGCYLMQFTGLHDKNDKEIWEGDVVSHVSGYNRYISEVFWREESLQWCYRGGITGWDPVYYWMKVNQNVSQPEVLGNIYENPELTNHFKR